MSNNSNFSKDVFGNLNDNSEKQNRKSFQESLALQDSHSVEVDTQEKQYVIEGILELLFGENWKTRNNGKSDPVVTNSSDSNTITISYTFSNKDDMKKFCEKLEENGIKYEIYSGKKRGDESNVKKYDNINQYLEQGIKPENSK